MLGFIIQRMESANLGRSDAMYAMGAFDRCRGFEDSTEEIMYVCDSESRMRLKLGHSKLLLRHENK